MKTTANILSALLLSVATMTISAQPQMGGMQSMGGGMSPMGGQPPMGGGQPPHDGQPPRDKQGGKKSEKKREKKSSEERQSKIVNQLYVYGIAYSPADSTVQLTDVLFIKNASVNKKTGFLNNRGDYANQLKTYLECQGQKNRTCVVVYNEKLGKLSKDYDKVQARYRKKNFLIKNVSQTDFRFQTIAE